MKNLKLKEENLVRKTELEIEKNQKQEDATLRAELEKKHLGEQTDFRKQINEDQLKLRKSLIGGDIISQDANLDEKAREKYEQQKH